MKKINLLITGHRGLVGSALVRLLSFDDHYNLVLPDKSQLNLLNRELTHSFFAKKAMEGNKIDAVICCAGRVGGHIPEELSKEIIAADYNFKQLDKIQGMVVPIGMFTRNPNLPDQEETQPTQYYTCKHFDLTSRNCLDYENRPDMCRHYPDYGHGGKCSYKGCEFDFEIIQPDVLPGSKRNRRKHHKIS